MRIRPLQGFATHGVKKISVDDAGFAVRMNVYRNNATGSEVVKPKHTPENHTGEVVNEAVNEVVNATGGFV